MTDAPSSSTNPSPSRSRDWIAGLSIAGLLLPEAVAYASIAALPPQAGVIALFAGLICYGLLGGSRFAIVSATSSSAAVLAASTASLAGDDAGLRLSLALGLVLVTGVFFVLASLARLGSVTAFIAKPVLRGFTFGLAIVIVLKQVASMVGVHPTHSDLVRLLPVLLGQLPHWNWPSVAVGATALMLLVALSRFKRLPGALLVIVLGVAVGSWLDLSHYGIGSVGSINLQLSAPSLPALSFDQWLQLGELGLAMVLVLYAESYGSIRNFANQHGDPVAPDRDLLALGAANIVAGLFQGMPVGAGYSATAANEAAGARSRRSGLVAAAVVLLIVLTVLPLLARTPEPVLAAIVIYAVGHSLNPAPLRPYFVWKRDRLVCCVAVVGVLLLGVLNGLLAAIALCLVLMLRQMASSSIQVLGRLADSHDFVELNKQPKTQAIPGLLILRPSQPLFFGNADRVLGNAQTLIHAAGGSVQAVILSLEESPNLDGTSLEALRDFLARLHGNGQRLLFARLKDEARLALQSLPETQQLGVALSNLSVDETVRQALAGQASN